MEIKKQLDRLDEKFDEAIRRLIKIETNDIPHLTGSLNNILGLTIATLGLVIVLSGLIIVSLIII